MFKQESLDRIDKFSRPARTFYNLNRWISIRIDAIGALFSSGLAAYLVYGTGAIHRPGYAASIGFSLNMAVGFSSMILWWVRILNEFEIAGNRLAFFAEPARAFLTHSLVWNVSRATLILSKSRKLRLTVFLLLTGQPVGKWSWRAYPLDTVLMARRSFITSVSELHLENVSVSSVAPGVERVP
jgi:hypothetical protein